MDEGEQATEFWLDKNLSCTEFIKAFESHFQGGRVESLSLVRVAKPGYMLFHLSVPLERKGELLVFLHEYAETRDADSDWKTAGVHPFNLFS
ncbi:MAG: hypothetical protein Q7R69_01020 [bacterium]|nr:hypothetical protein [bacterium]